MMERLRGIDLERLCCSDSGQGPGTRSSPTRPTPYRPLPELGSALSTRQPASSCGGWRPSTPTRPRVVPVRRCPAHHRSRSATAAHVPRRRPTQAEIGFTLAPEHHDTLRHRGGPPPPALPPDRAATPSAQPATTATPAQPRPGARRHAPRRPPAPAPGPRTNDQRPALRRPPPRVAPVSLIPLIPRDRPSPGVSHGPQTFARGLRSWAEAPGPEPRSFRRASPTRRGTALVGDVRRDRELLRVPLGDQQRVSRTSRPPATRRRASGRTGPRGSASPRQHRSPSRYWLGEARGLLAVRLIRLVGATDSGVSTPITRTRSRRPSPWPRTCRRPRPAGPSPPPHPSGASVQPPARPRCRQIGPATGRPAAAAPDVLEQALAPGGQHDHQHEPQQDRVPAAAVRPCGIGPSRSPRSSTSSSNIGPHRRCRITGKHRPRPDATPVSSTARPAAFRAPERPWV